jgi:hypothetical protein
MEYIQDDHDIRTVGDSGRHSAILTMFSKTGSTTNSYSDRVNDDTDLNNIIGVNRSLATTYM